VAWVANHTFPRSGIPFGDSGQCGYALGALIDFADGLGPEAVRPALYQLCSLHVIDGAPDDVELRRWAMVGALVTRYLFSIAHLPAKRDQPL
jgi:hypothetical protein